MTAGSDIIASLGESIFAERIANRVDAMAASTGKPPAIGEEAGGISNDVSNDTDLVIDADDAKKLPSPTLDALDTLDSVSNDVSNDTNLVIDADDDTKVVDKLDTLDSSNINASLGEIIPSKRIFKRIDAMVSTEDYKPPAFEQAGGVSNDVSKDKNFVIDADNDTKMPAPLDALDTLDRVWLAPTDRQTIFNFHDISFEVGHGNGKKEILKNISGTIQDGSMVAIMGPSGAGKTTLLQALSLSVLSGRVTGSIELNGQKMTSQVFKEQCYLVEQQDHHWPFLTCKETLMYAAELFLGPGDHKLIVDGIIEKMGLKSCEDTKVGNEFYKGLSGGQKRRLSVAIALLKKPSVIMLDEPTSGLDAASAVAIVGELRRLARSERLIIIMTIHQPSTKVYNDFDQLMLLSKGEQAYMGKAKEAPVYFGSIGHPMEEMTNPADFCLDLLNADFSSDDSVNAIIQEWKTAKENPRYNIQSNVASKTDPLRKLVGRRRSHEHEASALFRRHALMIWRDPFLYVGRCISIFFTTTIFALSYWNARERTQDQAPLLMYGNVWPIASGTLFAVVAVYVLNSEYQSVLKEVKNGMISPLMYVCVKSILVIPVMGLFAVCGISLSGYGILKLQTGYGVHLLLYAVSIYVFECAAEVCSVADLNPLFGMLQFVALWFTSFLFAGIFLPVDYIPLGIRWLYYALPFSTTFSAISYQAVAFEDWESCTPSLLSDMGPVCIDFDSYTGEEPKGVLILDQISRFVYCISSEDKRFKQMGTLLGMAIVAKSVFVFMVLYTSSQATKITKPPKSRNEQNYTHLPECPQKTFDVPERPQKIFDVPERPQKIFEV